MINDLLSALESELTTHIIETGNLKRKKPEPSFSPVWISAGYVAHNQHIWCSCGYDYDHILGVFAREKAPTGETRDIALSKGFQIPLGHKYPIETTHHRVAVCPSCVSSKGFERLENV